jgi:predicted nuclease of predicted toxin-antitoxin system
VKFLIDAQLPPSLASWIAARGHEADHVMSLGLLAASDAEIAARAEADGAVIVSKDEDFIIARLPDRFAFVWLRIGNATNPALIEWLTPRWPVLVEMLERGERFVELR